MFPMEFDHRALSSLPLPTGEGIKRLSSVLKAMVLRRVLPHFKRKRGTDPILLARVGDRVAIRRMEDDEKLVRVISFVRREEGGPLIEIHERIFDYLAFVIPSDPEKRLGEGTQEERKVLSFAEFMLRHELEHLLYPDTREGMVIRSDVEFAMDRRVDDPTFYRTLREVLDDEMNGIKGDRYLAMINQAEQGRGYESIINRVLDEHAKAVVDAASSFAREVFPHLDVELKTRVLGECYRRSRSTSYSLLRRASFLQTLFCLLDILIKGQGTEVMEVFNAFKDRWGLVYLLHELDLPEGSLEDRSPEELLELLRERLEAVRQEAPPTAAASTPAPKGGSGSEMPSTLPPQRTLTDRIEDARKDPRFPHQVMEVIDKNKLNAVGHSGSKYSELIETLLAVPWGKIQPITVSAASFEEGLDRSHYGLRRPKEVLCDFFANLIWRYQRAREEGPWTSSQGGQWRRMGSAFLFVGPPGVGKTSLAISVAQNLGIPYHKISLGGMRDETDIRGHGFTYEGSKPGAVVQGLVKMGVMNGMFIMDEADKTEKFAIATLLEILDPEQNHLFHDKYTETTVDIDLSNCHFVLTANTLDTVPPAVVNRCEVVMLDRYSVEEKVCIATQHLIPRLRERYQVGGEEILFHPEEQTDLIRYLVKNYTYEAGVRELERVIRTLFLRIQRKEVLGKGRHGIRVTREKIREYLEEPARPRQMSKEDRVGEILALGVDPERGVGSVIPIQATVIHLGRAGEGGRRGHLSIVHATGNIERVMDESRKVATTGIYHCAQGLGIDLQRMGEPIHLHFMGGSTRKDGPSAGGAIALALGSLLSGKEVRRDVAMTGEIDTHGRIMAVGALEVKLETACDAGCKTMIIPRENLSGEGGIGRLPDALKQELQILTYEQWRGPHEPFDYNRQVLQVVGVDDIIQAAEIAFLDRAEIEATVSSLIPHAHAVAQALSSPVRGRCRHLQMVVIKDPCEVGWDPLGIATWGACDQCVLLTLPAACRVLKDKGLDTEGRIRIREFHPDQEGLTQVVRELLGSSTASEGPLCVSLVAPFFFIRRDGISAQAFPPGPGFLGLRLIANNYTAQDVKIKGCKGVLSRVYSYLGCLESPMIHESPFVEVKDGIYVVDLSFMPEKYRLDIQRAEQLLGRVLNRWLMAVEERGDSGSTVATPWTEC